MLELGELFFPVLNSFQNLKNLKFALMNGSTAGSWVLVM